MLQNLLEEGVHIRDMRTIVEALAEHAPTRDRRARADAPACASRWAARSCSNGFPATSELQVMGLDSNLERRAAAGAVDRARTRARARPRAYAAAPTQKAITRQQKLGLPPVLLVQHALARAAFAFPAPQPAAIEGAVVRRSARDTNDQSR